MTGCFYLVYSFTIFFFDDCGRVRKKRNENVCGVHRGKIPVRESYIELQGALLSFMSLLLKIEKEW